MRPLGNAQPVPIFALTQYAPTQNGVDKPSLDTPHPCELVGSSGIAGFLNSVVLIILTDFEAFYFTMSSTRPIYARQGIISFYFLSSGDNLRMLFLLPTGKN